MSKYNEEFMGHISDTVNLMLQPFLWKYYFLLAFPVLIIYEIGNGVLFMVFLVVCCLFGRSAKLGGLLGWFIVSLTIFMFFNFPEPNHFIEFLLRAPSRYRDALSSEQVNNAIPITLSSKIFWSLVFGVRGGMIVGFGVGMLGRIFWGYHPKIT